MGAASAGIVEETGKAAALWLVINKLRYRWTLNGLLFGAAVGAGFASFESAGYALEEGLKHVQGKILLAPMLDSITYRGLFSMVGGHVLWTGMVGAALWRVREDRKLNVEMLTDARFARVFGLAVVLHMIWNSPFQLPLNLKYISLGFVAWVVILGLIQNGLRQIREAQQEGTRLKIA